MSRELCGHTCGLSRGFGSQFGCVCGVNDVIGGLPDCPGTFGKSAGISLVPSIAAKNPLAGSSYPCQPIPQKRLRCCRWGSAVAALPSWRGSGQRKVLATLSWFSYKAPTASTYICSRSVPALTLNHGCSSAQPFARSFLGAPAPLRSPQPQIAAGYSFVTSPVKTSEGGTSFLVGHRPRDGLFALNRVKWVPGQC